MSSATVALHDTLLALQRRDLAVRAELQAEGTLFQGYHPRMQAIHRENATQLREIIERSGWPNERVASQAGAEAAWLIAQHAIAEPDFMRHCRNLLQQDAHAGRVPAWQYAYLDDRIRVCEGNAQRFGTQFELTPDGPVLCAVEDPPSLDQRRREVGLGPIQERLAGLQHEHRPSPEAFAQQKAAETAWRRTVGWLAG